MMANVGAIYRMLGGDTTFAHPIRSYKGLLDVVRTGIPKQAVGNLVKQLNSTPTTWAVADIRNAIVPEPTFRRNDVFRNATAERLIRIANLRAKAEEVIGNEVGANEFMFRPHPELYNKSPLEQAKTEVGARLAETVLERAAYGFPI